MVATVAPLNNRNPAASISNSHNNKAAQPWCTKPYDASVCINSIRHTSNNKVLAFSKAFPQASAQLAATTMAILICNVIIMTITITCYITISTWIIMCSSGFPLYLYIHIFLYFFLC